MAVSFPGNEELPNEKVTSMAEFLFEAGLIHYMIIDNVGNSIFDPWGSDVVRKDCYPHMTHYIIVNGVSKNCFLCFPKNNRFDCFSQRERYQICNYYKLKN